MLEQLGNGMVPARAVAGQASEQGIQVPAQLLHPPFQRLQRNPAPRRPFGIGFQPVHGGFGIPLLTEVLLSVPQSATQGRGTLW